MCVNEDVHVSVCECVYVHAPGTVTVGKEVASRVYYRQFENHGALKQTAKITEYLGTNGASF